MVLAGNRCTLDASARTWFFTKDTPLPLTLTGSDPEGQALTFAVVTRRRRTARSRRFPAPTCSFGFCTVTLTYTPNPGFDGDDSFTYRVSDGIHAPVTATISLVGNRTPSAFGADPEDHARRPRRWCSSGFDPELATLTFAVSTRARPPAP